MIYLSKLTKRLALGRATGALAVVTASLIGACAVDQEPTATLATSAPAEIRIGIPGSLSIAPDSILLHSGDTTTLIAIVRDRRGRRLHSAPVTWLSTDPSRVTVSTSGFVSAVRAGFSTVTASSGNVTDGVMVAVVDLPAPPPPPVDTTTPPPPAPAGPPGTVTDLAVASRTDSSLVFEFTAASDGAGSGASYVMRLATPTLSWGYAQNVSRGSCATPITAIPAGQRRSCEVTGLAQATAYQAQVVAYRGSLASIAIFGQLSNVAAGTTLGASAPPPPPATTPVASVTLDRISASLVVAEATTFIATPRDSAGNALTGRIITWSSNNTLVATVGGTGTTVALAVGSAGITATAEGRSAVAMLTVGAPSLPPPTVGYAHEPSAFSVLREDQLQGPIWAGNGTWRDGWSIENLIDPQYNVAMGLPLDATALVSSPTTLEFKFDVTSRSGGGPRVVRTFASANHLYVSVHFRLSADFTSQWGPGSMKLFVIEPNNVIVSLNHWNPQNNGSGPRSTLVDVWSRLNNGGHDYLNTFQPAGIRTWTTVTNGSWHQLELVLRRGASAGSGSVEWWLDGVLQGQHSGLTFGTSSNGSPFSELKLTPQQGGYGSPAPRAMDIRFDHVRLSRAP